MCSAIVIRPVSKISSHSAIVNQEVYTISTNQSQNPRQNPIIKVHVPSYLIPWINSCYYLLLIPFKVKPDGTKNIISRNRFQRLLCGIIHPLVCIYGVLEVRGKLSDKVGKNPALLGQVADRLITLIYCLIYYPTVWRGEPYFEALMTNYGSERNSWKVKRSIFGVCYFVLVSSFLALVFTTSYFDAELVEYSWFSYKSCGIYAKAVHLELGFSATEDTELSLINLVATLILLILKTHKWILVDMISFLTALLAFACYIICKKFHSLMRDLGHNETLIQAAYSEVKELIQKINDLISPLCIMVFGSMVVFTAVRVIEIVYSKSISSPYVLVFYLTLFASTFIFSAESNYQGRYFKTWLFLRLGDAISLREYIEGESCSEATAIKGTRFFTITYRFLGTAFSVVLTYSIIVLQFRSSASNTM